MSGGGGLVAKSCLTLVTQWTVARQACLSMGFSRQEYWSGLPFLLQVFFPTQELNPGLLHCKQILYQLNYKGDPWNGDIWNGFLLVGNELATRMVGSPVPLTSFHLGSVREEQQAQCIFHEPWSVLTAQLRDTLKPHGFVPSGSCAWVSGDSC